MPRRTRVWWDAGTGKSHVLIGLGHAAVEAGKRVRYLHRRRARRDAVPGLADNSVGKVIEQILRAEVVIVDELGFAPLDDAGRNCCSRFVAGAYERVSSASAATGHLTSGGRFLPEHTTAVSMLDRLLHHGVVVVTDGESFRMREARQRSAGAKSPRGAPPTKTTRRR